jgi:hypothetical protein
MASIVHRVTVSMEQMFCIRNIPQSEIVFSFSRKNIETKTLIMIGPRPTATTRPTTVAVPRMNAARTFRSVRRLSPGAAALHRPVLQAAP